MPNLSQILCKYLNYINISPGFQAEYTGSILATRSRMFVHNTEVCIVEISLFNPNLIGFKLTKYIGTMIISRVGRYMMGSKVQLIVLSLVCLVALPIIAIAESALVFDPRSNSWKRQEGVTIKPKFARSNSSPIPREMIAFSNSYRRGTIIIDTNERLLYRIETPETAVRYAIGVGREGFDWKGKERITRKAEWPSWVPPVEMRKREAEKGRILPARMEGGPGNPLGARALYLGNTLYRIHGTNEPWTIGQAVSSGCIRMANDDVIHLFQKANIGDVVIVK